jgi:hypothetical protein
LKRSYESDRLMSNRLEKFHQLTNDIIIVDGFWGSGKSVLNPIVSSMQGVEMVRFDPVYEYACILQHLGKITPDAANFLFHSYSDDSQYSNLIGRHVNLRWSDQSGLSQNPHKVRALRRLFSEEGDSVIEEIDSKNLAAFAMSHQIMSISSPLFAAFGERLKFIEIVRHPLYLVQHWYSYLSRIDSKRDLTPSLNINGMKVPWFAASWSDLYIPATNIDRALLSIIYFYENLEKTLDSGISDLDKVLTLSFESMVFEPEQNMPLISNFLGRSHHPRIEAILRKEKLPRSIISKGKGYSSYGWAYNTSDSEEAAYQDLICFIEKNATVAVLEDFQKVIGRYNRRFPSRLGVYM